MCLESLINSWSDFRHIVFFWIELLTNQLVTCNLCFEVFFLDHPWLIIVFLRGCFQKSKHFSFSDHFVDSYNLFYCLCWSPKCTWWLHEFLCTLQSPNAAVACPSMRRSLAPPKIACKKPDTDSVFIRVPIRNPGLGSTTSPNSKHPSGTGAKLTSSLLSLWFIIVLSLWRLNDFLWFAVGRF